MKHYLKLYKSKNFEELKLNPIKSIKKYKKRTSNRKIRCIFLLDLR